MGIDRILCYFFAYAVLGYIVEVLYCSIPQKRFVNRGFLYGPYLPIYGFGALFVVYSFSSWADSPLLVFLGAFFGTSMLEYASSMLLEYVFHAKLWDYSTYRANLHGRVCLLNSTLFGLLSLFVFYVLHPRIIRMVGLLDDTGIDVLAKMIVLVLSIDATSSILSMAAFQKQVVEFRIRVKEIEERIHLISTMNGIKALEAFSGKLDTELEELRSRLNASAQRILDAFPSITSANEEKRIQFEALRSYAHEYRMKKKQQRKIRKEQQRSDKDNA